MVDGSFLRYYDVQGKEKNDEIKKIRWHNDSGLCNCNVSAFSQKLCTAEEIVLLSRPILYAIITVAALILIVIAWWKKENSTITIIVLIWMGALLLRNYAMYHLGNISAPLLLQLITDRVSETFIYEHAMQQYAIVVAKLDAFGTAICMIVTTLYQKDHFRNIKVNLILFIAVILGVNFVDGYIDKPEFIILIVNAFNLLNLFIYTKELNKGEYR